jgi:hypothetical protein
MIDFIKWLLEENKEFAISLIAFAGVFLTAFIALRNNNKNLLIKTVTEERAKWRSDLRNYCAEFSKLVSEQINNTNASNLPRIFELKAQIQLRTNPSDKPEHILDQDIRRESLEIVRLICDNPETNKEIVLNKLLRLEGSVQRLLKQEWDKSKNEAVTGKLSK